MRAYDVQYKANKVKSYWVEKMQQKGRKKAEE
jgi:hypothetical protein